MTATLDLSARCKKQGREARQFTVSNVELRETAGASPTLTLDGYACITDEPYPMFDFLGEYDEVVRAGAFGKTLAEQADVRLLLNHDGMPLARTKSGTLRLAEDSTGLAVEADLEPRSGLVNDIRVAMERGDLDEMSFAFQVTRQEWSPDYTQRDIQEVKLFDVSVVTYPANPATSVSVSQRMANVTRALAERRALDAEDVNMLTQALGWLSAIDNIVDDGQETLAAYLNVPNPDIDDADVEAIRALHARLTHRAAASQTSGGKPLYLAQAELLSLA